MTDCARRSWRLTYLTSLSGVAPANNAGRNTESRAGNRKSSAAYGHIKAAIWRDGWARASRGRVWPCLGFGPGLSFLFSFAVFIFYALGLVSTVYFDECSALF